jgi:hypothetical protein
MGGYTGLPEVWNAEGDGDDALARAWAEKAYAHVSALPPKTAKAPKAPQAAASGTAAPKAGRK